MAMVLTPGNNLCSEFTRTHPSIILVSDLLLICNRIICFLFSPFYCISSYLLDVLGYICHKAGGYGGQRTVSRSLFSFHHVDP